MCWQGWRATRTLILWKKEHKTAVTSKTIWQFLIKINIYLPYSVAIQSQVFTQGIKNLYSNKNLYANVYNRFIHIIAKT